MNLEAIMNAMMNDPEAAQAATEMMAMEAEIYEMLSKFMLPALGAALLLSLLMLIATWRIFKKAGTGGWKALIPFYSDYTLFKISWKKKYFWILLLIAVLGSSVGALVPYFPDYGMILMIAQVVLVLIALVIALKREFKLAKAFGKGAGFGIGLILLPIIFYPILGFGKAKFRRRKRRRKAVQAEN